MKKYFRKLFSKAGAAEPAFYIGEVKFDLNELKQQVRQVKGPGDVQVIVNSNLAAQVYELILQRSQGKKVDPPLAKRWANGDGSAAGEILEVLHGTNVEAIRKLVDEMFYEFVDDRSNDPFAPGLGEALMKHINDPVIGRAVIMMVSSKRVPGYVKALKQMLFSGSRENIGLIVSGLGNEKGDMETVRFVIDKLSKATTADEKSEWACSLVEHAENSSDETAYILREQAMRYMLHHSGTHKDIAGYMCRVLCYVGNEAALPFLHTAYSERWINPDLALRSIVRIKGKSARDLILEKLGSKEESHNAIHAVSLLPDAGNDEEIIAAIMKDMDRPHLMNSTIRDIVAVLREIGAGKYIDQAHKYIQSESIVNRIRNFYELKSITVEDVHQRLLDIQLIPGPLPESVLASARRTVTSWHPASIAVLERAGILYHMDAEGGSSLSYDDHARKMAAITGGVLNTLVVSMEPDWKVVAVMNDKVYFMHPCINGKWYDVSLLEQLMNAIMEGTGRKERFVQIPFGRQDVRFMFGDEQAVKTFLNEFRLDMER